MLQASFYDRTMLRNALAFEAARRVGMPWAPRVVYAELTVNGTYRGLYQLTELIKYATGRVAPEGGQLLVGDVQDGDDPFFFSNRGFPLTLKDPDTVTPEQLASVETTYQHAEDTIYSSDFADPTTGYASVLDVDSWVNWYIVNELFKNLDSTYFKSIWMQIEPDGKLAMGPPWDFDPSGGQITDHGLDDPTGFYLGRNYGTDPDCTGTNPYTWLAGPEGHYLNRLLSDPAFVAKVKARWQQVQASSTPFTGLPGYLDTKAAEIADGAKHNYNGTPGSQVWLNQTFIDLPNVVLSGSWSGDVAHLRQWLAARVAWLDTQWGAGSTP